MKILWVANIRNPIQSSISKKKKKKSLGGRLCSKNPKVSQECKCKSPSSPQKYMNLRGWGERCGLSPSLHLLPPPPQRPCFLGFTRRKPQRPLQTSGTRVESGACWTLSPLRPARRWHLRGEREWEGMTCVGTWAVSSSLKLKVSQVEREMPKSFGDEPVLLESDRVTQ